MGLILLKPGKIKQKRTTDGIVSSHHDAMSEVCEIHKDTDGENNEN